MNHSNKEDLLRKIKALAERGIDGEKESAQIILSNIMEKYGFTESDLEEEQKKLEWFSFHEELDKRLLTQIIYMVTGKHAYGCRGTHTNRTRKKVGIECTTAEKLEIEASFEFFARAIKNEVDIFFIAFANKNNLFPSENKVRDAIKPEETPEQKAKRLKATLMMEGMEIHQLQKMLEQ